MNFVIFVTNTTVSSYCRCGGDSLNLEIRKGQCLYHRGVYRERFDSNK